MALFPGRRCSIRDWAFQRSYRHLLALGSVGGRQGGRTTSQGNYHLAHPEAKGIDPIRLPNYVRLIMTSNEDWVVPAGMNERRFCVLDVDPRCEQNYEYFREIDEELAHGGLEYLLADLLAFDLDTVNLRPILRTQALLKQKIRSLGSVQAADIGVPRRATRRDGFKKCRGHYCSTITSDCGDGLRKEARSPRTEPWAHPSVRRGPAGAASVRGFLVEQRVQWPSETGGSNGDCGLQEQPRLDG
jgi:hypothetical protein